MRSATEEEAAMLRWRGQATPVKTKLSRANMGGVFTVEFPSQLACGHGTFRFTL